MCIELLLGVLGGVVVGRFDGTVLHVLRFARISLHESLEIHLLLSGFQVFDSPRSVFGHLFLLRAFVFAVLAARLAFRSRGIAPVQHSPHACAVVHAHGLSSVDRDDSKGLLPIVRLQQRQVVSHQTALSSPCHLFEPLCAAEDASAVRFGGRPGLAASVQRQGAFCAVDALARFDGHRVLPKVLRPLRARCSARFAGRRVVRLGPRRNGFCTRVL